MRAVETGSSVGSSYVDALAYAVSSCVTEPSWRRGVGHGAGQPARRLPSSCQDASRCLRATQWPKCHGVSSYVDGGAGPALGAHRHSGTDPRNSQRARRVALACEVVSEDHITRSKTARGAIADPDFHLPHENKNVLSPRRGVPIAPIVRRETAEHEVGTRLKRNVVALLGRQREIFKMGLAVVARIYPYDHARAPSHREIIVHVKAYSASSPTPKPLASLLRTLPPDKSVANGRSSKVTASSSACKQSAGPRRTDRAGRPRHFRLAGASAALRRKRPFWRRRSKRPEIVQPDPP